MIQVPTTVLMVGANDKCDAINELPVRLVLLDTGEAAIRFLKREKIDTVVSHWNLVDVPDGKLLANIIEAMPSMPTVALVEPDNIEQEIKAAQLGVTVILPDDIDDVYFRQVIAQLVGVEQMATVRICSDYGT